jgi:hypothetical protein
MVNWTEKRLERLQQLHKVGFSATAIARKLGPDFTKSIVLRKVHQLEAERLERARVRAARKTKAQERSAAAPVPALAKVVVGASKPNRPATTAVAVAPSPLRGVSLFDLREGHCRWPVAGERIARLFCGSATVGSSSWCEQHQRIAFAGLGRPAKHATAGH